MPTSSSVSQEPRSRCSSAAHDLASDHVAQTRPGPACSAVAHGSRRRRRRARRRRAGRSARRSRWRSIKRRSSGGRYGSPGARPRSSRIDVVGRCTAVELEAAAQRANSASSTSLRRMMRLPSSSIFELGALGQPERIAHALGRVIWPRSATVASIACSEKYASSVRTFQAYAAAGSAPTARRRWRAGSSSTASADRRCPRRPACRPCRRATC